MMSARPCFVRNAFTRADLNHRKFNRTTRIEASLPHSAHQRLQRNGERTVTDPKQGFTYRPVRPNRCGPVPVYRSGLVRNRSVPIEFKFEFKFRSTTGSYRYTGRLDRFTGLFDW